MIPDAVEPIAIAANAGVNNRGAPCTVNVLLAGGAVNICICTWTGDNGANAAVALKKPANDVIVPARGATNA